MKRVRFYLDRYKIVWVVLLCALALLLFSASTTHAQTIPCTTYHYVQPGQNLFRISMFYGVSEEDMMAANRQIVYPWRIYAGDTLCVPPPGVGTGGPAPGPPIACRYYHQVAFGQTLSQISLFYGVNMNFLAQVNGIPNVNLIYAGEVLCIP